MATDAGGRAGCDATVAVFVIVGREVGGIVVPAVAAVTGGAVVIGVAAVVGGAVAVDGLTLVDGVATVDVVTGAPAAVRSLL